MKPLKFNGFTLIELMIVVAIIGILASIAIPRFAQMLEKSREGSTKGNLSSLKSAAAVYYADIQGIWPTTLNSDTMSAFSRYLDDIPPVKVTGAFVEGAFSPSGNLVTDAALSGVPTSPNMGWLYDSNLGNVYVNSTVSDSKAIPYSFYGFE